MTDSPNFNDTSSTLDLLLSRRSGKSRDMVAPGPSPDELKQILGAGLRVPDHGKIAPWRFVVIEGKAQQKLSIDMVAAYRAEKPNAPRLEIQAIADFAVAAPTLVAVLSRPDPSRKIPLWEQHLSAGAACQNMLVAAHGLGYHGQWLTGWPAYSAAVLERLGGVEGDQVAGFLFFGTVNAPLKERPRPQLEDVSWSL